MTTMFTTVLEWIIIALIAIEVLQLIVEKIF